MIRKAYAQLIYLIHALHIMVVIVNNLQNKELFKRLTFKNRTQNSLVLRRNSKTSTKALNFVFKAMKVINCRDNVYSFIILLNKAQNVVVYYFYYSRILEQLTTITIKVTLKLYRKFIGFFTCNTHVVNSHTKRHYVIRRLKKRLSKYRQN